MPFSDEDRFFLRECIDISAQSLDDPSLTPFGAIVVVDGAEVARGVSSVIVNRDPTSHAEICALRGAGQALGTHEMPAATMYCSGSPCPMCLAACYWAGVKRIVTAARLEDSAAAGFEDSFYFEQLQLPADERFLVVEYAEPELQNRAADILRKWKTLSDEVAHA